MANFPHVHMELSRSGGDPLVRQLDKAQVLEATVQQLMKDLGSEAIIVPAPGPEAFEALRGQVLPILETRHAESTHALQVVLYRVDLHERAARDAMDLGGVRELAGRVVLRCLQKVITRMAFRPH